VAYPRAKTELARTLRTGMTSAEKRLWSRLRASRFHGFRFLRQEPIDRFIVDFYCSAARLVIELDGDAHSYSIDQDRAREEFLEDQGIHVIRFSNYDVMHSLDWVLEKIYQNCECHVNKPS